MPSHYPDFSTAHKNIWVRIFKLPFKTVRDTKLQTFQYRLLHHFIPCNEWLFNIKIKNSNICSFCNETDTLPHFFVKCRKVNNFWKYWFNWWKILTNQDVMNQYNYLAECILMGFPETSDDILVLNYCIPYTKYYIFIQWLFNNNELDLYVCQKQVTLAMNIGHSYMLKNKWTSKVLKKSCISMTNYNATRLIAKLLSVSTLWFV